ncbi:MAG: DUF21 domain-containing protein [Planctomycetes bacterium]|nr:DUF21 domain-containing protein [Planctomycetota bacterium]
MMINIVLLILVAVFFVFLSGLFSGAETGMYQLSPLRLRLGIEKKRLPFIVLGKVMHDTHTLLISILIGNNLTHYVITGIVTYLLLKNSSLAHAAEFFATLIIAPILFIFAELIPKSIFFYRADSLMPAVAPVLLVFKKLFTFCGMVPLLKSFCHVFARLSGSYQPSKIVTAVHQPHIKAIVHDTREEGFLSPIQTDIINRLTNISKIDITAVMTPLSKIKSVNVNSDRTALLRVLEKSPFTRLPVYENHLGNIIGFINIYETLSSSQPSTNLRKFLRPIREMPSDVIVTDAISIMQSENEKIVLVTKSVRPDSQRPIGIITMKDLVEELLGELAEW